MALETHEASGNFGRIQGPIEILGRMGLEGPMLPQGLMGIQKSILNSRGPVGFRGPLQFRESKA